MSKQHTISETDVDAILSHRKEIAEFTIYAVSLHHEAIMREIRLFDTCRRRDPSRWAKLCCVKSILSPGADLDRNIEAAHLLYTPIVTCKFGNPNNYDDFGVVKNLLRQVKYGGQCYSVNVKNIMRYQSTIAATTPADMTWNGLARIFSGFKTRSWALALYNANNAVFTLDRHELRGLLALAGIRVESDIAAPCASRYRILRDFMLDLANELFPNLPPLCIQWALWNEFRHPGVHASHAELAR